MLSSPSARLLGAGRSIAGRRCLWFTWLTALITWAQPVNPPRLSYGTYAAPMRGSILYGLATDSAGYAYVAGAYWIPFGADSSCGLLTKLNQTGSAALWSVCLPIARLAAVALDPAGYIYVVGTNQVQATTGSTSTVMKLSPDAQQTLYSTFIPGTYATQLALDRTGNVYVTGGADATFTVTPGAYLTTGGGSFVEKIDASGGVLYATYLDLEMTFGGGLTVDSWGRCGP